MRAARFYGSLAGGYVLQCVKARLAYRADLWAGLVSDLASQAAALVFIVVVYSHVPDVRGWAREEMIFIYGYFLLPFSLFNAVAANLWDFADRYVVRGELDRVLTRPLHSLFQVMLETVDVEALLGFFTGVGLMLWAGGRLGLEFRWWDVPALAILVVGSTAVYVGIFVALASVAFWTDSRTGLIPLLWNLNTYGRYPVEIYQGWLRVLLTWAIPLAFTAFYPATLFLDRTQWHAHAMATPVAGLAVFVAGLAFWNAGVRRYRGAGW